jgi:hypothetical protein
MTAKNTKSIDDHPTTDEQWRISEWFAAYKGIPLPPECKRSRLQWWRWLQSQIIQIDRQDAHAASVDFGLELDLTDPVSIIGALKYATIADQRNKFDRAKQSILTGIHPYTVQDEYSLTDKELDNVTKNIELNNPEFEIDWGSV